MTATSDYQVAHWLDTHAHGARVIVPGSEQYWLNAFTTTPQSGGCCEQTQRVTRAAYLQYVFHRDDASPRPGVPDLAWFRAFGIKYVVVAGARSSEAYHALAHPSKFADVLPSVWHNATDDTIYQVPQVSGVLAHIISASDLPKRTPDNGIDVEPLSQYIAAIEHPVLPTTKVSRPSADVIKIRGTFRPGDILSVQIAYHPGWDAGTSRISSDRLGLLVVTPRAPGEQEVTLTFSGGTEGTVTSTLSIGVFLLYGGGILVSHSRQRQRDKNASFDEYALPVL
jgi:hypothetical protein